jgi:hypothetical protein
MKIVMKRILFFGKQVIKLLIIYLLFSILVNYTLIDQIIVLKTPSIYTFTLT